MNRKEWYQQVGTKIVENVESFYEDMYGATLVSVGSGSRINPCPVCGHNDCCTTTIGSNWINCFSPECGFKGNHINAFKHYCIEKKDAPYNTPQAAIRLLESWTNIKYPVGEMTPAQQEAMQRQAKVQDIRSYSVLFYHKQLLTCDITFLSPVGHNTKSLTPLEYQKQVRKHKENTLREFRIGFSANYSELRDELHTKGYTDEDIKEAKVWMPDGVFIYPYFDPHTGDILRFNTKNPFNQTNSDGNVIQGYSTDTKVCGFSPKFRFDKDIIFVEGENDAITVYEEGFTNVAWIGGNLDKDKTALNVFNKCKGKMYCAFDNDEAGNKYYEVMQDKYPNKDVRKLDFAKGLAVNDIDEYFKTSVDSSKLEDLIKESKFEVTEGYVIEKITSRDWVISNRHKKIEFKFTSIDKNGCIVGDIDYSTIDENDGERLVDRIKNKSLDKASKNMKPFTYYLSDMINEYLNSNLETRKFNELIDIYPLSNNKTLIIKELAKRIEHAEGTDKDKLQALVKGGFDNDSQDLVWRAINNIQNTGIIESRGGQSFIPKMKISQYFNITNDDGYMYFTREMRDGDDTTRRIPYLLKNNKQTVRLDLILKADEQSLLLVDKKYEIKDEVRGAIMDDTECSLGSYWADQFIEGNLTDDDINPYKLIKIVEGYLRRFYYAKNEDIYKVLALYIFTTYYYELFGEMPYLLLNGEKGSGKSTLDTALQLFCFNAKLAVNISESSLFRLCSIQGGTIILDEMESLTSRNKAVDSTMGPILKSGYSKTGSVYRTNMDTGGIDAYSVYGPKIISNIFGVEDVIGDRCIEISTYRVDLSNLNINLEDPKRYAAERLGEIREITSKCCISALTHFRKIDKIFSTSSLRIKTTSPRAAQIIKPLLSMAKFVDIFGAGRENEIGIMNLNDISGEYEQALLRYHDERIVGAKERMDAGTPEGALKSIIKTIAEELQPDFPFEERVLTIPENYRYRTPIAFSYEEGWFRVDAAHLRCFLEQYLPGVQIFNTHIGKWIKSLYDLDTNSQGRRVITLEDDSLIKDFNGSRKPKVSFYQFKFSDFGGLKIQETKKESKDNFTENLF